MEEPFSSGNDSYHRYGGGEVVLNLGTHGLWISCPDFFF